MFELHASDAVSVEVLHRRSARMLLILMTVMWCLGGCATSRTVLVSREKNFEKLCGTQDELAYDVPLFKKQDSGDYILDSGAAEQQRIGVLPKGTKVTIRDVYREEWYRIPGNAILQTSEFPVVSFTYDGKQYDSVLTRFYVLTKNSKVGLARPFVEKK